MKKFAFVLVALLALTLPAAMADTLTLPEDVTIVEAEAFFGTDAETIILPEGVTFIGDGAFGGSSALREVYVPDALMDREEAALAGSENARFIALSHDWSAEYDYTEKNTGITITKYKGSETDVVIPSRIDDKPVTMIGTDAFKGNALLSRVVIPEGVTYIESGAFSGCVELTDITFPDSLTYINANAFKGCGENATESFYFVLPDNLDSTTYGDADTHGYPGCKAVLQVTPKSTTAYNLLTDTWFTFEGQRDYRYRYVGNDHVLYLMAYVGAGTEADIPANVDLRRINKDVFKGNERLTRVAIPEGVTYIESGAFDGCVELTDITFPDSLTYINANAFNRCGENATKPFYFVLPDNLDSTTYGDADTHGYPGCKAVLQVTPKSATAYNLFNDTWFTFEGQHDYRYRYVGNDHVLYLMAYVGSDAEISIPGDVELQVVNDGVFKDCAFLTKIAVPSGVTTIRKSAFENCVNLSEISLPNSLTSIQWRAFRACGSAVDTTEKTLVLVLPGNITDIVGYGDDESETSDASFKYCAFTLVTGKGTSTANSLIAKHYNFFSAYDAETGALGGYVHWKD